MIAQALGALLLSEEAEDTEVEARRQAAVAFLARGLVELTVIRRALTKE